MKLAGVEITIFQIILLAALVVVVIVGYINQRRRVKAKEDEDAYLEKDTEQKTFSAEEKAPLKEYILKYNSEFSEESLRVALRNNGYDPELIEVCLKENF